MRKISDEELSGVSGGTGLVEETVQGLLSKNELKRTLKDIREMSGEQPQNEDKTKEALNKIRQMSRQG